MEPRAGLSYWAGQVVQEVAKVSHNFDPDPVHDLRVALRRCRSIADGFLPVDSDPGWKQLKKTGKELFRRLGDLRDLQVIEEWVIQLGEFDDPVRKDLLALLAGQEAHRKQEAEVAVHAFDPDQWEKLARHLSARTRAIPLEGLVFQHMATERWQQARELQRQALRNRTQVSLHRLRIGLKKLRYTVENFLPQRHARWGNDLRKLQDLLGEIHDLDVLAALLRTRHSLPSADRQRWVRMIAEQRQERLQKYRQKMLRSQSLWKIWRDDLPQGARLREAALSRMQTWAGFLDPDVAHSRHVAGLTLQLYDGLTKTHVVRANEGQRELLQLAAILHDVGASKGKRGHHKRSWKMIRKMAVPLGWSDAELRAVAAISRYHRGSLPQPEHPAIKGLPGSARDPVVRLAGILRLANALDQGHNREIQSLRIERQNGTIIVHAEGYNPTAALAQGIAAARYLLESSCNIAVVIRPSVNVVAQSQAAMSSGR